MTTYRLKSPDGDATQYLPTDAEPLAFSDNPYWLKTALEIGALTLRLPSTSTNPVAIARRAAAPAHTLALAAHGGVELIEPRDWIIRTRYGRLHKVDATTFDTDYELTEPTPAPTTDPTKAGA